MYFHTPNNFIQCFSIINLLNQFHNKILSVNISIMEKNNYTPHKSQKPVNRNTTAQSYYRGIDPHIASSELAMLKDYESLKIEVRHLQNQKYNLISQVEQLMEEKKCIDNHLISDASKGKNYQIQMLRIKQDEELSRVKRQFELRIDQLIKEIKHKDYQIRQKDEEIRFMQLKNEQLAKQMDSLSIQLTKCRQQVSQSIQTITHNQFTIKKLQMYIEQQQQNKNKMQQQIKSLLDIEAQKSLVLSNLQIQLKISQDNQQKMNDKLNTLTSHFAQLEQHIDAMKQKLVTTEQTNYIINQQLDTAELAIQTKQTSLLEQKELYNQLILKFDQCQRRLTQRQRQVMELMKENQRLYKELTINRHRLHEFGANYGVEV